MNTSEMRKMIVLKDLPSNIIEEAIIVLKSNMNIKNHNFIENYKHTEDKNANIKNEKSNIIKKGVKNNSKDYIIKEAENIITNYISNIEKPRETEKSNKQLQRKYNRLKIISAFWIFMSILSILFNIIK